MIEKHHADHPEEGQGLSDFERQLRSIKPSPPQTQWEDIAMELNPKMDADSHIDSTLKPASVTGTATTHLLRFASHAAAVLIGVAIGIAAMAVQQPAATTVVRADETLTVNIKNDSVAAVPNDSETDHSSVEPEPEFHQEQRFFADGKPNSRYWPLTPMARGIDSQAWKHVSHLRPPSTAEQSIIPVVDSVSDKPMSAQELLRELLQEQASLQPTGNRDSTSAQTTTG
jgi:hypothetical protein